MSTCTPKLQSPLDPPIGEIPTRGELNPFLQHGMCGCDTSVRAVCLTTNNPPPHFPDDFHHSSKTQGLQTNFVSKFVPQDDTSVVRPYGYLHSKGVGRSPSLSFTLQNTCGRESTSHLLNSAQLQLAVAPSTSQRCSRHPSVTSCYSRRACFPQPCVISTSALQISLMHEDTSKSTKPLYLSS